MSTTPLYTQEVINIGAQPNDGAGDPLRVAFDKVNNNFANLFQTFVNSTVAYSLGNTAGQVIFETCLLYTSPSPRDRQKSRMPSSA